MLNDTYNHKTSGGFVSFADPSGDNNTGREVPVALPIHDSRGLHGFRLEGFFYCVPIYIYTCIYAWLRCLPLLGKKAG